MSTIASKPVTIPAQAEQTFGNIRVPLVQIHWNDPKQPMRGVVTLRRCQAGKDGGYVDMPVVPGLKREATKVIPDLTALASKRAKAGNKDLQDALAALTGVLMKIAQEDGDI